MEFSCLQIYFNGGWLVKSATGGIFSLSSIISVFSMQYLTDELFLAFFGLLEINLVGKKRVKCGPDSQAKTLSGLYLWEL